MSIDSKLRSNTIDIITNILNKKLATDIEKSIADFSTEYAETNDTPFLLDSIYETKSNEIIKLLQSSDGKYLISAIKEDKIKPTKLAFARPEELSPERYEKIIKKRELEEYKKSNKKGTNAFTCSKCKKANSEVTQKQTRAGDEPPTTFVTCLECGHSFKF
jgi:DNA-directed RNA polymerase subunit M/transcription elongation factor TFIIS